MPTERTGPRRSSGRPRVRIVSPALPDANNGNAHTASRWASFLAPLADVEVSLDWHPPEPCDALVALHARRSAAAALRFAHAGAGAGADAPLAVVLTGTDLYGDLPMGNVEARHAIECARIVVVLQDAAIVSLRSLASAAVAARTRVIVQSAPVVHAARRDGDAAFVAVGHLRDAKDPATLWRAMRRLATDSPGTTLAHIGAPLDPALAVEAEATMAACPAYRWLGAMPHAATRRAIARARALVHPSRMEGGANVVIESIRSGVPVLASRIDGNVGLLGADYDGTFPVGDDAALAALMRRFLLDDAYAAHLAAQCAAREPAMRPACERKAVRALLRDLLASPSE